MQTTIQNTNTHDIEEADFDDMMANLFVLVTHHSLTQCDSALPKIVEHIHYLVQHADIECYPQQLKVLLKMQNLWRTKLFRIETAQVRH